MEVKVFPPLTAAAFSDYNTDIPARLPAEAGRPDKKRPAGLRRLG